MSKMKSRVMWLAVVLLGVGLWLGRHHFKKPSTSSSAVSKNDVLEKTDAPMSDAERHDYVAKFIVVADLKVEADKVPGSDEKVPGLLRVSGQVRNEGARWLDKLVLEIQPADSSGAVLGVYIENIAKKSLGPNTEHSFQFLIPAKKEFSGQFKHRLLP